MSKITWIIDRYLLDYQVLSEFKKVFEDIGIEYYFTQYIPMSKENEEIPFTTKDKLVFYGTLGYLDNAKRAGYSGIYNIEDVTLLDLFSNCSHLPLLNNDASIYSIQDIIYNPEQMFDECGSDVLFLRPIKDNKSFSGGLWTLDKIEHLKDRILNFSSRFVNINDFIIAKIPDNIVKEYRFIIVNGQVITGSQYKLYNSIYIDEQDENTEVWNLAEVMAKQSWQPGLCYTCDIAKLKSGDLKIIEINGFSGAGWYGSNKHKIIKAVSEVA